MRTIRQVWLLPLVLACGQLPSSGDGVVELVVTIPSDLTLEPGETSQLTAQAFDRTGAPVSTAIVWASADTTLTVDPASGLVTGVDSSGTGRVQASSGSLRSNLIVFSLVPPAEGGGEEP